MQKYTIQQKADMVMYGQNLRRRRKAIGVGVYGLAAFISCSPASLCNYENGFAAPGRAVRSKIAEIFDHLDYALPQHTPEEIRSELKTLTSDFTSEALQTVLDFVRWMRKDKNNDR